VHPRRGSPRPPPRRCLPRGREPAARRPRVRRAGSAADRALSRLSGHERIFTDESPLDKATASAFAARLKPIGVKVDIKAVSANDFDSVVSELEREGLAQYGFIPLYSGPSIYGVSKGLANIGATIFGTPLPETVGWQK